MTTFSDRRISLEARGLLAYLLESGLTSFSLADVQGAGDHVGRDKAIRMALELRAAGYINRTRGGYLLSSSAVELLNNYVFSGNTDFQEIRTFDYIHVESIDHDRSVVEKSEIPENPYFSAEPVQPPLSGLSEPLPPVAPPPSLEKPGRPVRERKPPQPPEVKALYPPLFELTKSPPKGRKAMGCYTIARNLYRDFGATPEQIAGFWDWFKTFSQASQIAARSQRPLNPPMPAQVYEAWPQFLAWWEARQIAARRQAEAQAARETEPSRERVTGDMVRAMSPFHPGTWKDRAPTLAQTGD